MREQTRPWHSVVHKTYTTCYEETLVSPSNTKTQQGHAPITPMNRIAYIPFCVPDSIERYPNLHDKVYCRGQTAEIKQLELLKSYYCWWLENPIKVPLEIFKMSQLGKIFTIFRIVIIESKQD